MKVVERKLFSRNEPSFGTRQVATGISLRNGILEIEHGFKNTNKGAKESCWPIRDLEPTIINGWWCTILIRRWRQSTTHFFAFLLLDDQKTLIDCNSFEKKLENQSAHSEELIKLGTKKYVMAVDIRFRLPAVGATGYVQYIIASAVIGYALRVPQNTDAIISDYLFYFAFCWQYTREEKQCASPEYLTLILLFYTLTNTLPYRIHTVSDWFNHRGVRNWHYDRSYADNMYKRSTIPCCDW